MGAPNDTPRSGYRTLREFLLGDLEALRLVLRGGSPFLRALLRAEGLEVSIT